jgi:hypothetical protein
MAVVKFRGLEESSVKGGGVRLPNLAVFNETVSFRLLFFALIVFNICMNYPAKIESSKGYIIHRQKPNAIYLRSGLSVLNF